MEQTALVIAAQVAVRDAEETAPCRAGRDVGSRGDDCARRGPISRGSRRNCPLRGVRPCYRTERSGPMSEAPLRSWGGSLRTHRLRQRQWHPCRRPQGHDRMARRLGRRHPRPAGGAGDRRSARRSPPGVADRERRGAAEGPRGRRDRQPSPRRRDPHAPRPRAAGRLGPLDRDRLRHRRRDPDRRQRLRAQRRGRHPEAGGQVALPGCHGGASRRARGDTAARRRHGRSERRTPRARHQNWRGNRKNAGFLPRERAYFDRFFGPAGEQVEGADGSTGPGLGWVDVGRRHAGEVEGPTRGGRCEERRSTTTRGGGSTTTS